MKFNINTPKDIWIMRKFSNSLSVDVNRSADSILESYASTDINRFFEIIKQTIPDIPDIPELPDDCKEFDFETVSVNGEGTYKGKSFNFFYLGTWRCCVSCDRCWKDMVKFVSDVMYIENESDFFDIVKNIRGGRTRLYFSKNKSDFKDPYQIGLPENKSEYYVETNLSANNSVSLVQKLVSKFGYEPIKIEL